MINRFPTWVWSGAWVLSFTAGMLNVIGLLSFDGRAVSHLTGTTSLIAIAMGKGDVSALIHVSMMLGSYLIGAFVSGLIIGESTLKLGRRYGIVLMTECVLILIALPLFQGRIQFANYVICCACGLQNAMVTTFSGTVIRTTHVTGMFTDLGISLGHLLAGIPINMKRIWLCLVVISGFFTGGVAATRLFENLSYGALLVPAAITGCGGLAYTIFRVFFLQRRPE